MKHAVFKVLPILVCRRGQIKEVNFPRRVEELKENILPEVQVLEEAVVSDETELIHLEKYMDETDVVLLYKPKLGLGNCVRRIIEFNRPVILFNEIGSVWTPLDALEYVYPRTNIWVAVDYEDINSCIKVLETKKKINNTKLLILNADYPHWERWLSRICGRINAVEERFGIKVEYIQSAEIIRRWQGMKKERSKIVAEKWMKEAEKIIEPQKEDIELVARLYLVMKDLLSEKNAQGLTMAYGDDPLPVPCFAYTKLRDEGIPSACEADIISLILMTILHYLVDKPSFMGNIHVEPQDNVLRITHCVAPTKMAGYDRSPHSYILRDQHWGPPKGVLSAFVPMSIGQKVTVCRLDGGLKNMVVTTGEITACQDLREYCRVTVDVRGNDVKKFVHKTFGNHHIMVYGDHRERLKELNKLFEITTVEV